MYTEVATLTLISLPGCTAEELASQGEENILLTKACFGPQKKETIDLLTNCHVLTYVTCILLTLWLMKHREQ